MPGFIDIDDNLTFHTHAAVLNMFGHNYEQFQRSIKSHGVDPTICIWLPKFIEDDTWDNQLMDNGRRIEERRVDGMNKSAVQNNIDRPEYYRRIVFGAYEERRLRFYRFVGVFELDLAASRKAGFSIFSRIATQVELVR